MGRAFIIGKNNHIIWRNQIFTLGILTPQKRRHFEDQYTPAMQVHSPETIGGSLGILRVVAIT